MKMSINIEGDMFEDIDILKTFMHARDLYYANSNARESIRKRLKYEDVADSEEKFLRDLWDTLILEAVDE